MWRCKVLILSVERRKKHRQRDGSPLAQSERREEDKRSICRSCVPLVSV